MRCSVGLEHSGVGGDRLRGGAACEPESRMRGDSMMVSASRSAGDGAVAPTDRTTSGASGLLVHGTHLVGGVHVDIDLMAPCRWDGVSFAAHDSATVPLLDALIGEDLPAGIPTRGSAYLPSITLSATAAPPSAALWLR